MEGVIPVQDITGRRKSKVLVCLLYFSTSKLLLDDHGDRTPLL